MRDSKRFPFYGILQYMSATAYASSDDWKYSSTEKSYDGTYWDIIENPYTGEYAYTNLEDINEFN